MRIFFKLITENYRTQKLYNNQYKELKVKIARWT